MAESVDASTWRTGGEMSGQVGQFPRLPILLVALFFLPGSLCAQASPTVPQFRRSTQAFPGNDNTWQTAFGDLDGDGDLDGVFASLRAPSYVLVNDGEGRFSLSAQTFPGGMHGIEIGDLDGDGDQDLFFAPLEGRAVPVYLNDGHGEFEATGPFVESSEIVRLVDLESDGDLDAYLLFDTVVYLNDGLGNFTRSTRSVPSMAWFSDLNGDGFVDIARGEWGEGFRVFLNDGTGEFIEHTFLPMSELTFTHIAFADMDGDGDTDAVYMDGVDNQQSPSGVLLNDGTGRFVHTGQLLPAGRFGHAETGDLNGDGYIDVVLQGRDVPAQIWLNDGTGRLVDSGIRLGEGRTGFNHCALADVDNDGDEDIFLTDTFHGNHGLWLNQHMEGSR